MKANQKFVQDDDAVSPVIGVILMVAITVVLAAVVFVLVQGLGDTGDSAPEVSFTKSEGSDTLTVARAPTGVNWDEFQIRANQTVTYTLNGAAGTGSPLTANQAAAMNAVAMSGGDVLEFCTSTGDDLVITIVHTESNSQVGSWEFSTIQASC